MKRFCWEICQLALEVTEGNGTLIEVGGLLHLIVACGSLYKKVHGETEEPETTADGAISLSPVNSSQEKETEGSTAALAYILYE